MSADIFCALYDNWKKEGLILYENENACGMLTFNSVVPGQAIIFPRRHIISLEDLTWFEAKDLMAIAVPETFKAIQKMYEADVDFLSKFYENVKNNPPFPLSKDYAEKMLADPVLKISPVAYNVGINCGKEAGQSVNHLHLHLFPRREAGVGIVAAMERLLQ